MALVTVAVEYPQSILKGSPTCSSHSSNAVYETCVAGWESVVRSKDVRCMVFVGVGVDVRG